MFSIITSRCHTVDRERFAELNIHGFTTIKVFAEIYSRFLGHKYSLLSKRGTYIHGKTFAVLQKTAKNVKV